MFPAVLAAWDKRKETTHHHLSGRREQQGWFCCGYYRKKNVALQKYEMTQWADMSLNWTTDWFCAYVCIHAEHSYYAVYKQYTEQPGLLQNKY